MREGLHSRGGQLISWQIFLATPTRILWPSVAIPTREPLGLALPRNKQEPWTAFQILECCSPSWMSRSGLGQVVGQVLQSAMVRRALKVVHLPGNHTHHLC